MSFGHFSFSRIFLNVARYMLSAISAPSNFTPISVRLFLFLFWFNFSKLFLDKNNQHSGCWQCPRQRFFCFVFLSLARLAVYSRFPRQKWNFQGPKFWSKIMFFFTLTNFSGHHKRQLMYLTEFPEHLSFIGPAKSRKNNIMRFLNFGPFLGLF